MGSSTGRFGSTPSPEDLPVTRRCTQGTRWVRAQASWAARFMEKPIDTEDFLLTVAELVTRDGRKNELADRSRGRRSGAKRRAHASSFGT